MDTITYNVLRGIAATRMWLQSRVKSERGAAAVEYGLLVALIAAVIIGAVFLLGGTLKGVFTNTNSTIGSYTG